MKELASLPYFSYFYFEFYKKGRSAFFSATKACSGLFLTGIQN
jgi:hypothetical protein